MADRTPLSLRLLGGFLAVAGVAFLARVTGVNSTSAGFLFLIVVLFSATLGGLGTGVSASLAASALFTFFLPPLDSVHVADPENWVALGTFLTAAVLASRLVTAAREQANGARQRTAEVEALNALTVQVLASDPDLATLARWGGSSLVAIGARAAGVLAREGGEVRPLEWQGQPCTDDALELGRRLEAEPRSFAVDGHAERDDFAPLIVGGVPAGVLVSLGTHATPSAVESVAKVLTLALERQRLLRERAHLDALRESEAMKTALLHAVSHDLSTPLTAIGFQIDALKRQVADVEARSGLAELERESSRLRRRIENLLALGRLEVGGVVPRPEPVPPADLFRAARESLSLLRRPLEVRIATDCPDALADPSLALEIVVNLLENADRASAEGAPVELVASPSGPGVRFGVLDRGRGVPELSPGREIDAGDVLPRGLGLEIARRFALASGGTVVLESRPGGGVAAWLDLPAAGLAGEP